MNTLRSQRFAFEVERPVGFTRTSFSTLKSGPAAEHSFVTIPRGVLLASLNVAACFICIKQGSLGISARVATATFTLCNGLRDLLRTRCPFTRVHGRVASVDRYTAAVKLLFDPENAQVDLLSLQVKVSRV